MRSSKRELLLKALRGYKLPAFQINFWDGEKLVLGDGTPRFSIYFCNECAISQLLPNPQLGFAKAYMQGLIDVEGDLLDCFSIAFQSNSHARELSLAQRMAWFTHRQTRRNTLQGSRRNIANHYDLGNHFYQLWLDRNMVYTCAYYPTESATLEEAQEAKMDLVCRKLRLQPGDRVVEAGCGWGGFAIFAAKKYGVSVKAFNLSREQIAYAREWVKRECVNERVEFIHDDYRNISGSFDAFVSIGMLEHVGKDYYPDFGRVIDRTLNVGGRGLIHFIGRVQPAPLDPWISREIFPGAHPPSLIEILPVFEKHDFYIRDVENLRLHYVRTLKDWLERFESNAEKVRTERGEPFVRKWRLYLAGSMLSFLHGHLVLYQITFNKGIDNSEPMTRRHLYAE